MTLAFPRSSRHQGSVTSEVGHGERACSRRSRSEPECFQCRCSGLRPRKGPNPAHRSGTGWLGATLYRGSQSTSERSASKCSASNSFRRESRYLPHTIVNFVLSEATKAPNAGFPGWRVSRARTAREAKCRCLPERANNSRLAKCPESGRITFSEARLSGPMRATSSRIAGSPIRMSGQAQHVPDDIECFDYCSDLIA